MALSSGAALHLECCALLSHTVYGLLESEEYCCAMDSSGAHKSCKQDVKSRCTARAAMLILAIRLESGKTVPDAASCGSKRKV